MKLGGGRCLLPLPQVSMYVCFPALASGLVLLSWSLPRRKKSVHMDVLAQLFDPSVSARGLLHELTGLGSSPS